MSELLDKQVDTQNENLKITIPGFTQALTHRGCGENKLEEKTICHAKLYKAISEDWPMNFGLY